MMGRVGRVLACAVAVSLASGLGAGSAVRAQTAESTAPFEFVAFGDAPYTLPDDYARFERLLAAINRTAPAFSIFVGDTKGGGVPCTDEILQRIHDYFMTLEHPLIYTPGDNEWTDCHRQSAGGYDPLERLARVRAMHFQEARSLGARPLDLTRQSDVSSHVQMVENARWTHHGVLFATIHMVGSNNGFERSVASATEYFARTAANIAWINEAFDQARTRALRGVVIAFQAQPQFDRLTGDYNGFQETLRALAAGADSFGRPVLLVHGDEHKFIIDQPLTAPDGRTPLENVIRLQVFGDPDIQAVRVQVDPQDPALFGFRPLIVPENLRNAPRS